MPGTHRGEGCEINLQRYARREATPTPPTAGGSRRATNPENLQSHQYFVPSTVSISLRLQVTIDFLRFAFPPPTRANGKPPVARKLRIGAVRNKWPSYRGTERPAWGAIACRQRNRGSYCTCEIIYLCPK